MGRREEGAWGRGEGTFLKKGSLPPPLFFLLFLSILLTQRDQRDMGGFLFSPLESGSGGAELTPVGQVHADGKNLGVLGTIAVLKRIQ